MVRLTLPDVEETEKALVVARQYETAGDWDAAMGAYKAALDADPQSAGAAFGMGMCQLRMSRPREALQSLSLAARLDPTRFEVWRILGILALLSGKHVQGLAFFEAARKCQPGDEIVLSLIVVAKFYLGKFGETITALDAVPGLEDRIFAFGAIKAISLLAVGRNREAQAVASRCTDLFPDNAQAFVLAGAVSEASGNSRAAESSMRRAYGIAPQNYEAIVGLAATLAAHGHIDESKALLHSADAIDGDRFEAPLLLAALAFQSRDMTECAKWTSIGLRFNPRQPNLVYFQAAILAAAGDWVRAEQFLECAIALNPVHLASQVALARVQLRRGHVDDGTDRLRYVARISPNSVQGKFASGLVHDVEQRI